MTTVCFTGAGKRLGRDTFTRVEWERLARSNGFVPVDKVERFYTDLLVASRTYTVKAERARDMRVEVITYAAFEARIGSATQQSSAAAFAVPATQSRIVRNADGEEVTFPDRNPVRARCPIHQCTLPDDGVCLDCARVERRRGMSPGQHARPLTDRRAEVLLRTSAAERADIANRDADIRNGTRPRCLIHNVFMRSDNTCHVCTEIAMRPPPDTRPKCRPHGFVLEECNSCREKARVEAAKLAPIGTVRGKRVMNLDGED